MHLAALRLAAINQGLPQHENADPQTQAHSPSRSQTIAARVFCEALVTRIMVNVPNAVIRYFSLTALYLTVPIVLLDSGFGIGCWLFYTAISISIAIWYFRAVEANTGTEVPKSLPMKLSDASNPHTNQQASPSTGKLTEVELHTNPVVGSGHDVESQVRKEASEAQNRTELRNSDFFKFNSTRQENTDWFKSIANTIPKNMHSADRPEDDRQRQVEGIGQTPPKEQVRFKRSNKTTEPAFLDGEQQRIQSITNHRHAAKESKTSLVQGGKLQHQKTKLQKVDHARQTEVILRV